MVVDSQNGNLFTVDTIKSWIAILIFMSTIIGWSVRLELRSSDNSTSIAEIKTKIESLDNGGTRAFQREEERISEINGRFVNIDQRLERFEVIGREMIIVQERQNVVMGKIDKLTDLLAKHMQEKQ